MNVKKYDLQGNATTLFTKCEEKDGKKIVTVAKADIGENADYIDFTCGEFSANTGEDGYFVLPFESTIGVTLTYFTERENTEFTGAFACVSCYGVKKSDGTVFGVVTKGRENLCIVAGVKDGRYYAYPRFCYEGMAADEDIEIEYYELRDGNYSEMAQIYRNIQLTRFGCVPLFKRTKADARLARAAESIAVRIRQAWKPVPGPVEDQTPETEPPLHIACDFKRVGEFADTLIKYGAYNAELCLVGWNRMGHDGRYPQIFPAEPALGGESELKKLIKKVKENGFNIVCHDNACDGYKIAENWDEEFLIKNRDGSYEKGDVWSGGRSYKICPKRYFELFGNDHIQKLKALGFEGLHYMDVVTILKLLNCYDKNHPLTKKQSAFYYRKLMLLSREAFGGFSSESGYDFAADALDYAMYVAFFIGQEMPEKICDEIIPFWELVYHGIILYNPATYTLNYTAKKNANRLKYFEYGGRPLACIYANFADDRNWMGNEDLLLDTDEQMQSTARKIKTMCDDYEWLKDVRYAFMQSHNKVAEGVYETVYSNNIKVIVDYNTESVKMVGENIRKVLQLNKSVV